MRAIVAPFAPELRPRVLALYERNFGLRAASGFSRRWEWQFETNPIVAMRAPRLLAIDDGGAGRLTACVLCTPNPLRLGGQREPALCAGGFAMDPGARGRALELVRSLLTHGPGIAGGFHPSIRRIVSRFGPPFIPATRRRFSIRVRSSGLAARQVRKRLRGWLTPVAHPRVMHWLPDRLTGNGLAPYDASSVLARSPRGARIDGLDRVELREIDRFDDAHESLWLEASARIPNTLERTREYLNWRYVDCPTQHAICLGAYEHGHLRAFGVGVARFEPDWTGRPCIVHAEIVELIALDPAGAAAERLVRELARRLDARHHVDTISTMGFTPAHHPLFKRLGFEESPEDEHACVILASGSRTKAPELSDEAWYVSSSDSDALYAATL